MHFAYVLFEQVVRCYFLCCLGSETILYHHAIRVMIHHSAVIWNGYTMR